MSFLRKLSTWFARLLDSNGIGGNYISPDGAVARFVFESRKIKADGTPRPAAFEPERHPEKTIFETSVCGLNGVSNSRLWKLGKTIRSDKQAIAAFEIKVEKVNAAGLQCHAAPESHPVDYPEHGVIVGWDEDKSKRIAAQQRLAATIARTLRPVSD